MKIAILDLYNGEPNEGMRCIQQIIQQFASTVSFPVTSQVFDVRAKCEIADLSYDAYISTGGPGSPLDTEGSAWEKNYFGLMNNILKYNRQHPDKVKHVLLICHSFQIFCRYYGYAKITKRKSTQFGVLPVHKTHLGMDEEFLRDLPEPFYAVDSRDYQVLQPDKAKLAETGGFVACMEKERPLIRLERATMAIRFTDAIFGMQFHGEADNDGMNMYLHRPDKIKLIQDKYGVRKYHQMMELLEKGKINRTHDTILPRFLAAAANIFTPQLV